MKLRQRTTKIVKDIQNSFRRFPVTIWISFILVAVLIFLIEEEANLPRVIRDRVIRGSMVLGMGIFLSLIIGLINERINLSKTRKWINYILGIIFLSLYYIFLLKDFKEFEIIRYIGFMITFFILIFYIGKVKRNDGYEKYVVSIFSSIAITMIYSFVLLFGIFSMLFTISQLFDIRVDGNWYIYTFLIIFLIFGVSYFISKIPYGDESFKDYSYSKAFIILLSFIVIPLITVYSAILYAYFFKILISWQWPKGLVSHLVLWYSSFSVGVLFLINPIVEENNFLKSFKKYFPKFILPILIMMFISIGQRISQYGFTEERYFVVVLGIWVFGTMLYFSFKKSIKTIIIPISLSILVLNSVIGPISSFQISKNSQNSRLQDILERNNMIDEGQIVENPDISKEDKREINNIIYYFDKNHNLEDIKLLNSDYSTGQTEEIFGFKYEPNIYYQIDTGEYFYLNSDLKNKVIQIEEFDYQIDISSWGNKVVDLEIKEGTKLNYKNEIGILEIKDQDEILISLDLNQLALDIYEAEKIKGNLDMPNINYEDMTYEIDEEKIKAKLIFNIISGKIEDVDHSFKIDKNVEFTIFIDFRD